MANKPQMSSQEILNNSVALKPTQRVAIGATNAASSAINEGYIKVIANQNCWIVQGSTPVAVAADGAATFVPSGVVMEFAIDPGNKIGVIRDTVDGYLYITPGV